ncbi:hypothetical protein MPY17_21545 [Rhodococcus opacus]|uniref:hypothetical protein n=1 Tax=Rhodococcus opacus TaxID=37919 RepID=UPI001FF3FC91|nr:hypothetical protein [Rhodococcus opacus]UOT01580.1 hypothetical protein MPY17_21545 [Rhodococcus opacus]
MSNGVTVLEAGLWERPKDIYAAAVRAKTGGDPDVPATQTVSVSMDSLLIPYSAQ